VLWAGARPLCAERGGRQLLARSCASACCHQELSCSTPPHTATTTRAHTHTHTHTICRQQRAHVVWLPDAGQGAGGRLPQGTHRGGAQAASTDSTRAQFSRMLHVACTRSTAACCAPLQHRRHRYASAPPCRAPHPPTPSAHAQTPTRPPRTHAHHHRHQQIFGPEASGKTTLALHAIAEVQKLGGVALFIDAEHAFDAQYAQVCVWACIGVCGCVGARVSYTAHKRRRPSCWTPGRRCRAVHGH
jgi:hypothetical protein